MGNYFRSLRFDKVEPKEGNIKKVVYSIGEPLKKLRKFPKTVGGLAVVSFRGMTYLFIKVSESLASAIISSGKALYRAVGYVLLTSGECYVAHRISSSAISLSRKVSERIAKYIPFKSFSDSSSVFISECLCSLVSSLNSISLMLDNPEGGCIIDGAYAIPLSPLSEERDPVRRMASYLSFLKVVLSGSSEGSKWTMSSLLAHSLPATSKSWAEKSGFKCSSEIDLSEAIHSVLA